MATDYHALPDPEVLASLRANGLGKEADLIEQRAGIKLSAIASVLDQFITKNEACKKLKENVIKLAVHDDAVLIQGDSGTGKELIAQALGKNRKSGRFVAINVSAIPRELVESTLFGYNKGAFTGASADTPGLIQYAEEGTLFLDEVGDLSYDLQCKFLRVLQDRKVRRVGSNSEEEVRCRIIAATHQDLRTLVTEGKFRLDLYARLSTFVLRIPSLTERPEDIAAIITHLEPKFPVADVDWSKVDLSLGVRGLQQYARRWAVLGELPAQSVATTALSPEALKLVGTINASL